MSEDEIVIRKEAQQFYDWKLGISTNVQSVDQFHAVKQRLRDFYTPENKAIFLDEIQNILLADLEEHRKEKHGGQRSPNCRYEIDVEKMLFYIKQEIETFPKIVHQRFKTRPGHTRSKVFVSYSHFDKEFLTDVQRHFKPFLGKIDFWDDSKIQPGQKWKEEIRKAIDETKVAILLVSTDFLGSEFIATNEMPPLLKAAEEDGAVILSVILKPCLFEEFPELNQYQAMNPPSRTVLKMAYEEKEELYVNLVRQTKKILGGGA
jgi:hypothetical protein